VTPVGKKCITSVTLLGVTSATLPEVTLAISHSDRGSDFRREEMCHFGDTSRSHFEITREARNLWHVKALSTVSFFRIIEY